MAQFIDTLRIFIEGIILSLGYPGIALAMFMENFIPPIPSELIMVFSGFLVSLGRFDALMAVLAGTLGTVPGAVIVYHLGIWLDAPVIRAFFRRYGRFLLLAEADLDRALSIINRYGILLVTLGRFIPFIRTLIALPAGMNRMPLPRFIFFVMLGSLMYNSLLVFLGMQLEENWGEVLVWIEQYEVLVYTLLFVLTALFIGLRLNRLRVGTGNTTQLP